MGHFSNGTEGEMYQERYCFRCRHWDDGDEVQGGTDPGAGCPIWLLHEIHVGEKDWQPALDRVIPMEGMFSGECVTFWEREPNDPKRGEKPLTPGQEAGLREWKAGSRSRGDEVRQSRTGTSRGGGAAIHL